MINKKSIITSVITCVIMSGVATISIASSFVFSATTKKEVYKPGEEVIVNMDIGKINAGKEGINVIETSLEYDKDIFETMEFENQNDWQIEYNDIKGHAKEGKVLFTKIATGVTKNEEVGKIKFKIKDKLKDQETEIKLLKVTSNDGNELMEDGDKIIKIKIQNEKKDGQKSDTKKESKGNSFLPKTGQGWIIYIVSGVVIIGSIGGMIYLRIKNNNKE